MFTTLEVSVRFWRDARERESRARGRARRGAIAGFVALQLGCAGLLAPVEEMTGLALPFGEPPLELEQPLPESGELAAAALARRVEGRRFPAATAEACDEHAARFTWLAAREDDPAVLEAALWAMAGCEAALHAPDAQAVALRRLRHQAAGVVGGALEVARPHVARAKVHDPIVQRVVDVATSSAPMGVRIAALEVLDERAWGGEPSVATAFYDALQADLKPPLTATALERLRERAPHLAEVDRERFRVALMVLASDIDPGLRGYAARAVARLAPDHEEARALVIGMLDDEHGYPRAAAAAALADMGYREAIHELMRRLDDHAPTGWKMRPYDHPSGEERQFSFAGSPFERVDDAYLRALAELTSELPEPYVHREVDPDYVNLDILAAARDARAWYAEHKDSVPERGLAGDRAIGQADAPEEDR